MNQNFQIVDLTKPILSARKGLKPIFFNIKIQPNDTLTEGGSIQNELKTETYISLSALPQDLRIKVETAIQAIRTAI
jgi:hypothetical protein